MGVQAATSGLPCCLCVCVCVVCQIYIPILSNISHFEKGSDHCIHFPHEHSRTTRNDYNN